ncbi:MAG TPA: hypothetical protein VNA14_09230 [Mycobacteriales bacterium]|nr:hypothetical protein [Mycobacteriales bacterium]
MSAQPQYDVVRRNILVRDELLAAGWTEREIRWRLRSGQWRQLRYGVYVETALLVSLAGDAAATHAIHVEAAIARLSGDVVASHQSAALLHGFDSLDPWPSSVQVTREGRSERHAQRYRDLLVRSATLPDSHRHPAAIHGVPLTSGARTVVDLARLQSMRHAVVTADSALRLGRTTKEELAQVLEDVDGWPGTLRAAEAVRFADGRSESAFESVSRVGFHECRLPAPDLQTEFKGADGMYARVDFSWEEHHTVGEADGYGKYTDRADKVAQQRRQEWLEQERGLEVVRWTYEEVWGKRLVALHRRIEETFARAHRRWGD